MAFLRLYNSIHAVCWLLRNVSTEGILCCRASDVKICRVGFTLYSQNAKKTLKNLEYIRVPWKYPLDWIVIQQKQTGFQNVHSCCRSRSLFHHTFFGNFPLCFLHIAMHIDMLSCLVFAIVFVVLVSLLLLCEKRYSFFFLISCFSWNKKSTII